MSSQEEIEATRANLDTYSNLAKKLLHRRRLLGLSKKDVANALGVKRSVITRFEMTTGNIDVVLLQEYCNLLGFHLLLDVMPTRKFKLMVRFDYQDVVMPLESFLATPEKDLLCEWQQSDRGH